MLKVGLSSYSLWQAISKREMDIFDAINFIAERGGKHIEIVPVPGYYDINGNDKLAADIVKAAQNAGIEISSYTIGANFLTPPNGVRAEIERVKSEIDTAAKLGRPECATTLAPVRQAKLFTRISKRNFP